MFDADVNNEYVRINYSSDVERARSFNLLGLTVPGAEKVYHSDWLGGYKYPILDWIAEQMGGSFYQILKMTRPRNAEEQSRLVTVLKDPNTLYAYPSGGTITAVQFNVWDNRTQKLEELGIDIKLSQKLFKRIKTFNRSFRSFYQTDETIKVVLVSDDAFSRHYGKLDPAMAERLMDGAFILSPHIVDKCMEQFEIGTTVFDEETIYSTEVFNRNTEVGEHYRKSMVFNARLFGPMEILNEGEYEPMGALKGQAYKDMGGLCETYGADVIAPYSAFKKDINITATSFFLIEPQNAKLGQMFSDGQTIANLPALYRWKDIYKSMGDWFDDTYEQLVNNQILSQWSDMSFAQFNADNPKMFDNSDVKAITMWNVRAWLTCGGKLSDSPWLFQQMGKNIYDSMHIEDPAKLRFPVICAARAQVISESLLRGIRGITDDEDESYSVPEGYAHWDKDLSVMVVSDMDYIEMYESHGGCDLDDFFQIYWRTMGDEQKIIICRSPNDWGEYSIFDYVPGDWFSTTTRFKDKISFPKVSSNPKLWDKRLSVAVADGTVKYEGLPEHEVHCDITEFNADYILAAIEDTADSAASVGINVNARQLWADSMKSHRPVQLCSMEDCIDAGVQGGSDAQVQAVMEDGANMVNYLIDNKIPIDLYLWKSKHEAFYPKAEVELYNGNITFLQSVRLTHGDAFKEKVAAYAETIPANANYDMIHALGNHYLGAGVALIRSYRLNIAKSNRNGGIDPGVWEIIAESLVRATLMHEEGQDRASFVMGLYSACLKLATSSGRITDQLVMQPNMFKFLLESLQFYGILHNLTVDDQGKLIRFKNTEWKFYDEKADKMQHFTDPVEYQKWFFSQNEEVNHAT